MAVKHLCVTVGDHITSCSSIIKSGKSVHTLHQFLCATPPDCVQDGQITNPEALAAVLKPQFQRNGMKTRNLAFSVSSSKVAFREVLLPAVKDNRIQAVIDANAGDYFPIDLDKFHVSYIKLEEVEREGQRRLRVMAYAAPLAILEPYFKLAEMLGGKISIIDCSGNSQYQALREFKHDDARLFVHIDSTGVQMTFFQDGRLLLQRSLPVGPNDYIREYMSLSKTPPHDFLQTVVRMSGDESGNLVAQCMTEDTVEENLMRLASGVARSIGYFNQSFWETPVTSIILGGPCAAIHGIRAVIAKETALPTELLDRAVAGYSFAAHWGDAGIYENNIGMVVDPLRMIPSSLQPARAFQKEEGGAKKPSLSAGILVLVFAAVTSMVLLYIANNDHKEAQDDNSAIKNTIQKYEYIEGVHQQYISYQSGAEALLEIHLLSGGPNDFLYDFLEELEDNMPSDLIVLSMTCTQESVVMNATLSSKTAAAAMLVQLRAFESLGQISIPSVTEEGEAGMNYVSFSVTCYYR